MELEKCIQLSDQEWFVEGDPPPPPYSVSWGCIRPCVGMGQVWQISCTTARLATHATSPWSHSTVTWVWFLVSARNAMYPSLSILLVCWGGYSSTHWVLLFWEVLLWYGPGLTWCNPVIKIMCYFTPEVLSHGPCFRSQLGRCTSFTWYEWYIGVEERLIYSVCIDADLAITNRLTERQECIS